MMTQPRTLYRSRSDKVIAGVCGGLAQYLDVDPVVVRLVFVALAFMSGVGLMLYVVLAIVTPKAPLGTMAPERPAWSPFDAAARCDRPKALAAVALILVGSYFLLANVGFFHWLAPDLFWPLLLVGIGSLLLAKRRDVRF